MVFFITVKPILTVPPESSYVMTTSELLPKIVCVFKAKPAAVAIWTLNNGDLPVGITYSSNVTTEDAYMITTTWLHREENETNLRNAGGRYKCHAENIAGKTSEDAELFVMVDLPSNSPNPSTQL